MCKFTLFTLPLLSTLLIANHNGFDNNSGHLRITDYAARSFYTEGYENFIFAQPDKNITAAEAKAQRLDPGRHLLKLNEMKRGRDSKTFKRN